MELTMGYYTQYMLKAAKATSPNTMIDEEELEEIFNTFMKSHCAYDFVRDYLEEPIKWYTHEADMENLALAYPDYIFYLQGAGESAGDEWEEAYYKDKKVESVAVLPPLDLDLLDLPR